MKFSRNNNKIYKISYNVPKVGSRQFVPVQIKIYNELGDEITILDEGEKPAGSFEVEIDGSRLRKGIYFYQVFAGSFVSVREMISFE